MLCFLIRHDSLRSLVQAKKNLSHFWYCLCVFLDFRSFWGIYVIFSHFGAATKRSNCYSLFIRDFLRTTQKVKKVLRRFFIFYACFLIFWSFWLFMWLSTIFGYLQKYVKFCSLIHHNILRSFVKEKIFWDFFLYCLCLLLDFPAIFGNLCNIRSFSNS